MVGFQKATGISLYDARRKLLKKPHSALFALVKTVGMWSWPFPSTWWQERKRLVLGVYAVRVWTQNWRRFHFSKAQRHVRWVSNLSDRHSWRCSLQLCGWRCCAPSRQRSDWYYDRAFQRIVGREEGVWTSKCTNVFCKLLASWSSPAGRPTVPSYSCSKFHGGNWRSEQICTISVRELHIKCWSSGVLHLV